MNADTATYCGAPGCARPTTAGILCTDCQQDLTRHVESLPWDLEQLENAATNQTRFTTGGGAKSTETPLMFNPYASLAYATLTASIQIWQGRLADHTGTPVRHPNPTKAALWIGENLHHTRTFIDAGKMLDAFVQAHEHLEKTINRPPQRQYLGDCATVDDRGHTCPGRMFAFESENEARCDTCGKTIDAVLRRLELLRKLDYTLMTASEIARITAYMGLTINREQVRKRINQWSSRGRITGSKNDAGDVRFRFMEVRLLLDRDEETRQSA